MDAHLVSPGMKDGVCAWFCSFCLFVLCYIWVKLPLEGGREGGQGGIFLLPRAPEHCEREGEVPFRGWK